MQTKASNLLLHPAFLLSVFILLLNDFYLKQAYHNWFTGKLSDITGLFAFAVFLTAVSGYPKHWVIVFVILFFLWWKSPLSEPLILFLNDSAGIPVSRVCDYTDLWALAFIPLVYFIHPAGFTKERIKRFAVRLSAIVSFFAFCATSIPYRELYYYPSRVNEIRFYETFYSALGEAEVLNRLGAQKTGYRKDSVRYYRVSEELDLYYRSGNQGDSVEQWMPVSNKMDSLLFVKKNNQSYFTIPLYVLNGDSLLNIQMEIKGSGLRKRPTMIKIESFQTKKPWLYTDFHYGRSGKAYKKHFKNLFKK